MCEPLFQRRDKTLVIRFQANRIFVKKYANGQFLITIIGV